MNREGIVCVITNVDTLSRASVDIVSQAMKHLSLPRSPHVILSASHPEVSPVASHWSVGHVDRENMSTDVLLSSSQEAIILYDLSGPFVLFELIASAMRHGTRWKVYYVFSQE